MPNPAVFVFAMPGCGACDDYVPRFQQIAGPYRRQLPIGLYNVQDGRGALFSDKLGVKATPTTVVMDRHGRFRKFVGALGNAAIEQLLKRAATA